MAGDFRFSGISSGFDSATLIEQLMAIERRPVVLMQNRQKGIKTKADAWRDIAGRLSNLKSKVVALKQSESINAKSVQSSKATAVAASALAGATNGVHKVWVDRLATSTRVVANGQLGKALNVGAALADAGFAVKPTVGTFTINGKVIMIDADTVISDGTDDASSNSILGKINSSGAGVVASIEDNRMVLRSESGPIRLGSGADTSNFLTAAKLLGATATTTVSPDGGVTTTTVVSSGSLGTASTVLTLNKARLSADILDSYTGGVAEGDVEGKLTAALGDGETVAFTYHGQEYRTAVLAAGDDMQVIAADLEAKMNEAVGLAAGTIRVRVSGVSGKKNDMFVITDTATPAGSESNSITVGDAPAALKLAAKDGGSNGGLFLINGVAIKYDKYKHAVKDIINRINASDANVVAAYDGLNDRITLTAKYTGEIAVALDDVGGNFLAAANLLGADQDYGHNALYRIDTVNGGEQLSSASNTIADVLTNITLTLKEASSDPVAITVEQDVSAGYNAIKGFVDQYNSLMDLLASLTAYDAETKSAGTLQGNSMVRSIQTKLRSFIMTKVDGLPEGADSLLALGISSGKTDAKSYGLTIDDARLKQMLESDPDAVARVFGSAEGGIAGLFENYVDSLTKGSNSVISKTQELLREQNKEIDNRISDMERRLAKKKESLVRQFTQMEKVLSQMHQQQSWLASQSNLMGMGQ